MAEILEQKTEASAGSQVSAVSSQKNKTEAKAAAPNAAEPKKDSIVEQAKKMIKEKKAEEGAQGRRGAGAQKDKKSEKDGKTAPVAKGPARVYTIPLKLWVPRTKKTRKSIAYIKTFILKHTKQEAVIDPELNEYMWSRGKQKPPAKVRVSVQTTEEGKALVSLKKQ